MNDFGMEILFSFIKWGFISLLVIIVVLVGLLIWRW